MSISTLPFIKHLQGRLNLKLKSASNDFVLLQHVLCNASVINVGKYYYYYYTIRCNMQEANEEKHKPVALQSCIFFLWFCLLLFFVFLNFIFIYIFFLGLAWPLCQQTGNWCWLVCWCFSYSYVLSSIKEFSFSADVDLLT